MTALQKKAEDLNYGLLLPYSPALVETDKIVEFAVAAKWDGIMPFGPSFMETDIPPN